MGEYRATPDAIKQIQQAGELGLDYIDKFERSGATEFVTGAGAEVDITATGAFACLHLKAECAQVTECPRGNCEKLNRR